MTIRVWSTGTITTASDGSATKTSDLPLNGRIIAVIVDLGTATSADVKITPESYTGTNFEIFNVTGISADNIYYPKKQNVDKAGTAISGEYTEYMVHEKLTVTVANGGDTKTLTVKVIYER